MEQPRMPPPRMRISAWRVADAGSDTVLGSLGRFWQHKTTRLPQIPASKPTNRQTQPQDINILLAVRLASMVDFRPSDQSAKGRSSARWTAEGHHAEGVSGRPQADELGGAGPDCDGGTRRCRRSGKH